MWKVIGESVEGTSHTRTLKPCQDAHRFSPITIDGVTFLLIACSDGAGSAELAEVGARMACDTFFETAYESLRESAVANDIDRDVLLGWYLRVQDALEQEAARRGVPVRHLACTLLTALVGPERAVFAQVGDGSIVFRDENDRFSSAFWPQSGEYANATNFVTQPGIERYFEFFALDTGVDEIAVFTDGLQRLALDFRSRSVHQPFFEPMFAWIRDTEHADELTVPFRSFLNSTAVNDRTDDDKTLVLATRRSRVPVSR
jgi:hypothetical protein